MKKKLIKALCFLPDGQGIELGDDTFLSGALDGSDKIYGFGRVDGEIRVLNGSDEGYSIDDLGREELRYIFKLSVPNIFNKIRQYKYRIYDIENI